MDGLESLGRNNPPRPHPSITRTAELTECYEGQEGILLWGSKVVTNKCDIRQMEKSEGKPFVWRQQTGARQWQELARPGSNGECTAAADWSRGHTRTQRLLGGPSLATIGCRSNKTTAFFCFFKEAVGRGATIQSAECLPNLMKETLGSLSMVAHTL